MQPRLACTAATSLAFDCSRASCKQTKAQQQPRISSRPRWLPLHPRPLPARRCICTRWRHRRPWADLRLGCLLQALRKQKGREGGWAERVGHRRPSSRHQCVGCAQSVRQQGAGAAASRQAPPPPPAASARCCTARGAGSPRQLAPPRPTALTSARRSCSSPSRCCTTAISASTCSTSARRASTACSKPWIAASSRSRAASALRAAACSDDTCGGGGSGQGKHASRVTACAPGGAAAAAGRSTRAQPSEGVRPWRCIGQQARRSIVGGGAQSAGTRRPPTHLALDAALLPPCAVGLEARLHMVWRPAEAGLAIREGGGAVPRHQRSVAAEGASSAAVPTSLLH